MLRFKSIGNLNHSITIYGEFDTHQWGFLITGAYISMFKELYYYWNWTNIENECGVRCDEG